jgi:phosphoglycolate phosphatase
LDFKNKELIIFDFDGTLINSIPDLALATNKMLTHYSLPNLSEEQITPFIGNGAKPLVRRALENTMKEKEITVAFFEEAFEYYVMAYRGVTCEKTYLYPGVLKTLKYLKEEDYKMSICTNKPFRFIEPILEKLSIKSFFGEWIGEDSLAEKKPSALPLLHLAGNVNMDIDKCVMIGDSKNDILAAQNAKMESIGVSYGYNYNENIGDYNPTVVLDNFAALQELF